MKKVITANNEMDLANKVSQSLKNSRAKFVFGKLKKTKKNQYEILNSDFNHEDDMLEKSFTKDPPLPFYIYDRGNDLFCFTGRDISIQKIIKGNVILLFERNEYQEVISNLPPSLLKSVSLHKS